MATERASTGSPRKSRSRCRAARACASRSSFLLAGTFQHSVRTMRRGCALLSDAFTCRARQVVTPPGFEPGMREPESLVLPLHHGVTRRKAAPLRQRSSSAQVLQKRAFRSPKTRPRSGGRHRGFEGYPARIRTWNEWTKTTCVTVTPRGSEGRRLNQRAGAASTGWPPRATSPDRRTNPLRA